MDRSKAKRFQPYGRSALRQEQPEMDDQNDGNNQQSALLTFVKKSLSWLWAVNKVPVVEGTATIDRTTASDEGRVVNKNGKRPSSGEDELEQASWLQRSKARIWSRNYTLEVTPQGYSQSQMPGKFDDNREEARNPTRFPQSIASHWSLGRAPNVPQTWRKSTTGLQVRPFALPRRHARRHVAGRFSALGAGNKEELFRRYKLERERKARAPPSSSFVCWNITEEPSSQYLGYRLPPQLFPTLQYGRRTKLYNPNLEGAMKQASSNGERSPPASKPVESKVGTAEPAAPGETSAAPVAADTAVATTGESTGAAAAAKALSDWESAGIKFPDCSDKWKCGTCEVRNKRTDARCVCCFTRGPRDTPAAAPTAVPASAWPGSIPSCAPPAMTSTCTSSSNAAEVSWCTFGQRTAPTALAVFSAGNSCSMGSPPSSTLAPSPMTGICLRIPAAGSAYGAAAHNNNPQLGGFVWGASGAGSQPFGAQGRSTGLGAEIREYAMPRRMRAGNQHALPTPAQGIQAFSVQAGSMPYSFNIGAGPIPGEERPNKRVARRGSTRK